MRIAVLVIAVLIGGWLLFDGTRALTMGDYVTHRGELGPWSRVVAAVGLAPRGTVMKIAHVVLGIGWLAAAVLFGAKVAAGRPALLACSLASLWYLPLGTVLSIAVIVLLWLPSARKGPGARHPGAAR